MMLVMIAKKHFILLFMFISYIIPISYVYGGGIKKVYHKLYVQNHVSV